MSRQRKCPGCEIKAQADMIIGADQQSVWCRFHDKEPADVTVRRLAAATSKETKS